jgi:hypothetical protein
MENRNENTVLIRQVIRLTARILSIVVIGVELLLLIGEGLYPSTTMEWIGLLFFPIGISAGMVLAWWKEGMGGMITAGSLVAFYVIHYLSVHTFPKGLGWFAFSVPGFLFLLYWYLTRDIKGTGR